MTMPKKEGIDRKYLSVRDESDNLFKRNDDKIEANVNLDADGDLKFTEEHFAKRAPDPYVKQVNMRFKQAEEMPKISFDTKELYEHAHYLCQQVPHWKKDSDNPIFQYICESEKPFQTTSCEFFSAKAS